MKKRDNAPTREELLRAFAATPPAFKDGVDATLRRLAQDKEERVVKRKLTLAPALALALVLLLAGVALAAALYPRTADRFGELFGEEFGARLSQGDIAESGDSYTLGDVTYTMTDVIYEGSVLYGTVVMEPAQGANVVLLPEETEVTDPAGYNIHYGEEAPADAKSYKELAQERGARIVLAKCVPDGYLLDGELLSGDVGYTDTVTPEGTIVSSFELHGWNGGIERDARYVVRMRLSNWEVTSEGEYLREEPNNTWKKAEWDVTLAPEMRELEPETTPEPITVGDAQVIVPAGYDGALPSYAIAPVNYMDVARPEMITDAAIAQEDRREHGVNYTFEGDDQLDVGTESVYFYAYDGTEEIAEKANGETVMITHPRHELGQYLSDLASWEWFKERGDSCYMQAEAQQDLTAISYAQAQEKAGALLAALGLQNAHLVYARAVDMEHAKALSDERNAEILAGKLLNNNPRDISDMTEADEGYQLAYRAEIGGVPVDEQYMTANAFVSAGGIRSFSLYAPFALGEALGEPQTLISAEEALAKAVSAAKKSWLPELAPQVEKAHRVELIYMPRDKTKLVPAWRIVAMDGKGDDAWSIAVCVSAVDGKVLDAPWM